MITVGYGEQGIDAKNHRQAIGLFRIDFFIGAGESPGAFDPLLSQGRSFHRFGRGMMQKSPQAAIAKLFVGTGKEDKFMPCHIDDLGWHGDHGFAGTMGHKKIVA